MSAEDRGRIETVAGCDVTVKRYGDYLRVIAFLHGRPFKSSLELHRWALGDVIPPDADEEERRKLCNIFRAKSRIRELALCNRWDYFVTLTLSPEWGDRCDLPRWRKDLTHWLRDLHRRKGAEIKYLFVPEEHKKGGWHMHGFVRGIPADMLRAFTLRERLPKYLRDKLQKGFTIYDWPAYRQKYGWVDLEPIRDAAAVSRYITKYVVKALQDVRLAANAHSFYSSQGLAGAEEVIQGRLMETMHFPWHNEYEAIIDLPADEWLDTLMGLIVEEKFPRHITRKQVEAVWHCAEVGQCSQLRE